MKIEVLPESLSEWGLEISDDAQCLVYTYDTQAHSTGITRLVQAISAAGTWALTATCKKTAYKANNCAV